MEPVRHRETERDKKRKRKKKIRERERERERERNQEEKERERDEEIKRERKRGIKRERERKKLSVTSLSKDNFLKICASIIISFDGKKLIYSIIKFTPRQKTWVGQFIKNMCLSLLFITFAD